ncbi:winged helix-turn-helix transcriptional regulator, partial [Burkholderia cenocepacia]|uniref:winged helix-turn-helix transcriptional regulator n=1 Tax=Burkholderia cenocepacia TaxID=95486 RepID=UPI003D806711
MRPKRLDSKSGCAVEVTLSVIGGLWKPVILFHLLREKRRFMELTRLMSRGGVKEPGMGGVMAPAEPGVKRGFERFQGCGFLPFLATAF